MVPDEEIQAGETQPAETPVEPVIEETPAAEVPDEAKTEPLFEDVPAAVPVAESGDIAETPVKKSFWSKVLPWVIVAAVFFLGGMATIFFAVHQPAKQAAATAAEDAAQQISTLTSELEIANNKLTDVQAELDTTAGDLSTAQATIEEQTAELTRSNQIRVAYKFLADVNAARTALQSLDVNASRQSITFARTDLADLQATGLSEDSTSGFAALLDEALNNLSEPDLLKSRDALNNLYSGLLTLINNL